jgi:2-polyprenyl-6-methoxyphenol hydroxylase-like FAD-dependent oxidoreductase
MSTPEPPTALRNGASHDVVVVGARAAGAATAMLLARRGVRTVLLDHSPPGTEALCTHALMRGGVLQLARWGLLDAVIAAGTPPVTRTTQRYGNENVVVSIKRTHAVAALYAPRRAVLDSLLLQAAIAAGVEVHERTSVTDVITHRQRVIGVSATTGDGRAVELVAPLLIGADGIDSTIAPRVGARCSRVGAHASAMTYGHWSDLATDSYEWNFRRNACSGVVPTNAGQACVFACGTPQRIGRGGVSVIRAVVAEGAPELADRLGRATPPHEARTWHGRPGYLRQCHGPGWALVGDAGYYKDPISAHGLTDALRDAELLARAVIDGLDHGASALDEALADYQATRDRLSIPLFDVVDRIASQQWADAEIAQLLLQLSSAATDEVEALAALETEAA